MSSVRWRLTELLEAEHTYGYQTKSTRMAEKIEKSHVNDAFIIARGNRFYERTTPFVVQQVRRNNRSLRKFYDAKYIDARTGEKVSGQDLYNGRTTRNKEKNEESLRVFRQEKVKKGYYSYRRCRYPFQPNDLVKIAGHYAVVAGAQNGGAYVKLKDVKKVPKASLLALVKSGKGFCFK